MKRDLIAQLKAWKQHPHRKPLLLNGVRQVGKTYLLQHFGAEYFPQTHYFNFEKDPSLRTIFTPNLEPKRIINELSFSQDKPINLDQDLVILDEIQACPLALTSLKYFQEEMPSLALASAGSLLGLSLGSGSFPVGKVDMLTLHPLSFSEFLMALDDKKSLSVLQQITPASIIPDIVHQHLWQQLKIYFIVGGLPEAVAVYQEEQLDLFKALHAVRTKQKELIKAYYADIAKHAGKVNSMHIDRIWNAVPAQLATAEESNVEKFKFKDIIPGINRYSRLTDVIDWLEATHLVIKVPIVNCGLLPFSAYCKENTFKLFIFDVGILGAMSDLPPKTILDYDYGTYKGYFAENYIAQAFLTAGVEKLYSWRENTAEIEFLREINGDVIPVEVKAGTVTKAKSLKVFTEKYHPIYRVIFSAKNLYCDNTLQTHYYPIYLAGTFPQ
jgi:predicted AAA+ superfamily ATPase